MRPDDRRRTWGPQWNLGILMEMDLKMEFMEIKTGMGANNIGIFGLW